MSIQFKFSDGQISTAVEGRMSQDKLANAIEAIQLFIRNNSVTYNHVGKLSNPLAAELIVNGETIPFNGFFTYGALLRAFNIDENNLADFIAKAKDATPNKHIMPKEEVALKGAWNVYRDLAVKFNAVTDFTPEQKAAVIKFMGDLCLALTNWSGCKVGTYQDRLNTFESTVNKSYDEVADTLDLSVGECILNAIKEIMNFLMLVVTFGQVDNFFKPAEPVHLIEIEKAFADIQNEVFTKINP